ncbi:hypothetical protein JTE90_020673 [Oedothorax gibbosus]|uniref:CCHC-type domain-containing protein n=1 Tax=Oedothorax gibbosus TaxID=931172 RepID=A0AAV6US10_9ARAC|nr:hypothetical protein JTE90_020673 [Oedothorax gibbosus]
MVSFGIFIRSTQDDLTIIEKCKNLLASIQSDTKILHVHRDEDRGGLKVVFDTDSSVAQLLQRKDLDVTSTIHALTTALIVHEAFPNDEEEFKASIRNKMATKVLDIKKVPLSAKYPEIGTGKWIIILDVPEIEDLDEFKLMGLPENMLLLKLPNNDCKLKVEFYCRLCQKGGHVPRRCSEAPTPSFSNLEQIASPKKSSSSKKNVHSPGTSSINTIPIGRFFQKTPPKIGIPPKPMQPSGFRIRDIAEERNESLLKSLTDKRNIKDFKVELGTEEVKRSLHILQDVKKEKHDTEDQYSLNGCSSATASSTSKDRDDMKIVYESPGSRLRPEYIQNPPEIENQVTTTNCKRRLSYKNNSNQDPQARKKLRILPVVIPDGIRQIISGIPEQVLDIQKLEAFFTHAKKKSRPLEIVKMYTSDAEGFKRQLVEISRKYYMSPNVGSNADIQFVKMLQGVLKRFKNPPPTPKNVSMTQQIGLEQSF